MGLQATIRGHGPHRGHFKGAVDGGKIWWVARNYRDAEDIIWPDLKRATENLWQAKWAEKSEVDRAIILPNGGSVSVRSADNPDSLRGVGLDGAVVDEAAFIAEGAWKKSLRATLSDKRGWAILPTTPNGLNWLYDLFASAPTREGWEAWQRPTSDNPLIDQAELDEALLDIGPSAFAQEYGAGFTDIEGAEFSGAYFGDSIWFDDWPELRDVQWRIVALDPSKGKTDRSDYSAYVMLALHLNGTMYVDADLRRRDVWRIVEDGIQIAKWFQPHAFGVEVNQFQEMLIRPFSEQGLAAGVMLPIYPITNTLGKRVRIRSTLTPFLARGEIKFRSGSPGAKLLVEQLRAFPVEKYDDGPDALEMAVSLTRHVFENGGPNP